MRPLQQLVLLSVPVCCLAASPAVSSQNEAAAGKFYRIIDGKVDARTYNSFRRYHAGCNHCHGPDGVGSTFASSLVDRLLDPNFALYVDDIYAYLQARADGALGRGRHTRREP
ncbi:MAG: cytochrome C [Mesorhizobium sp.]|nr:MAG: cytochrome C [Mesorhizobium sp.]